MTKSNRKGSVWMVRGVASLVVIGAMCLFLRNGLTAWNNYIPPAYDLRSHDRTAVVEDQGYLGTCWAFASLMALESSLLPEEHMTFSKDHMSNDPNFKLGQNDGGEYTMSMAYLLSWRGPVSEEEDPYGDSYSPEGLSAIKHVQEIQLLPEKDYDSIKRAIRKTGGVQSALYIALEDRNTADKAAKLAHYCYQGTERPNHDIVIVGWDDHYPKESFEGAEKDGAFICENSWGSSFGDEGFFYVSYEDTNIGSYGVAYTRTEDTDNYDKIYQSDLCGWTGQMGYGTETAWAANVYTSDALEKLSGVGFYATVPDTSYVVYVAPDGADLSKRQEVARGTLDNAGYYTIDTGAEVVLDAHSKFGVIICLTSPETTQPIAIEYDAGDGKCNIDLSDGEGYLSPDGEKWEHIEETQQCNLCLKAYTDRVR